MASGRIRRLTKPDVLRQIDPARLLDFLGRFKDYFASVAFPLPEAPAQLDIDRLVRVLVKAQRDAPQDLIDALFLIDQMATVGGRDALKRVLLDAQITLPVTAEWSPADLAVEAWLHHRPMLGKAYASQLSTRNRTLQIFLADEDAAIVEDPLSDELLSTVRADLATRLQNLDRGDVELFAFTFDGGVRYVVQYGGVYTRLGVWNRGQSPSTIGYQPLEYDVVVFDSRRRELAVKQDPRAEQTALRQAFSLGLASNPEAFARSAVLDLEPIRSAREGCLWCRDVPGLRQVRLRAVKTSVQPGLKHTREERATDLFAAWSATWARLPRGLILKAEFEFEFDDSPVARTVALSRGATIRLTRDDDSELVSDWMRRRGFVLGADEGEAPMRELWEWLERPDEWLATEDGWRSRLGAGFPHAKSLLVDAQAFASSIRFDGEAEDRAIVHGPDGALLAVCQRTGAQAVVDGVAVALRRLEVAAVAQSVAEAMSLAGTVAAVEEAQGAWYIGEFTPVAGERFPVYLVTSPDEQSLREACLALAGISTRSFVLVTPTRRFATPKLNDRLGAAGAGWLALSECARLSPSGGIQLRQRCDDLLRPFLAIHLPQTFGVTRRPRFPTPPGATWSDVRIRFTDAHAVVVTVDDVCMPFSYEGMGMADKRTPRPTAQWNLLHDFATGQGSVTWDHKSSSRRNQKRRERLADDLRAFFGIDSDPFEYDDTIKGWRARFTVEPD